MLDRRGQVVDDRVEQPVGAQVLGRDAAGHREDVAAVGALLERVHDLLVRDLLALEVALHQRVGVLRHLVHQLLAVLLGQLRHVVGDRALLAVLAPGAGVLVGLHVDEVDQAAHLVLGADRDLGRHDVRAEGGLQRVERAEEVGPLAVEHVHVDQARHAELGGARPQPLRRDLDAHHGVDHEDGRLAHAQRAERVGDERGLAGRVDQVDLDVAATRTTRAPPRSTSRAPARPPPSRRPSSRQPPCPGGSSRRPRTAGPRAATSSRSHGGPLGPRCGSCLRRAACLLLSQGGGRVKATVSRAGCPPGAAT